MSKKENAGEHLSYVLIVKLYMRRLHQFLMTLPLTHSPSSEARNPSTRATSIGWPTRLRVQAPGRGVLVDLLVGQLVTAGNVLL